MQREAVVPYDSACAHSQTYLRYENENKNENVFFRFIKKLKIRRLVFKKRKRNKKKWFHQIRIKTNTKMNIETEKVSI